MVRSQSESPPDLKMVNYSGISFYVGPIHYDWVLNREKHVLEHLHRSIIEGKALKENLCTMIDVGTNDGFYSNMAGAHHGLSSLGI
jgi:hypothetical protein